MANSQMAQQALNPAQVQCSNSLKIPGQPSVCGALQRSAAELLLPLPPGHGSQPAPAPPSAPRAKGHGPRRLLRSEHGSTLQQLSATFANIYTPNNTHTQKKSDLLFTGITNLAGFVQ